MKVSILSLAPLLLAGISHGFSVNNKYSQGVLSKTAGWNMDQISPNTRIEGEARHTFSFRDTTRGVVQVAVESPSARPMESEVNLWLGPDYTPFSLKCHSENGLEYPIQTLIGTKKKFVNVEVKNNGPYTHPMNAACSYAIEPLADAPYEIRKERGTYVEGGAVKKFDFPPEVDQLQVLLKTDGKQLKAKVELLNGPNNVKIEYQVYASSGDATSLFLVFETPGAGNAIRVKNLATLEYPLDIFFKPSKINTGGFGGGGAMWT